MNVVQRLPIDLRTAESDDCRGLSVLAFLDADRNRARELNFPHQRGDTGEARIRVLVAGAAAAAALVADAVDHADAKFQHDVRGPAGLDAGEQRLRRDWRHESAQ